MAEEEDSYSNLPPNIALALAQAESRYQNALKADNPYKNFPVLASARILGVEFFCHENLTAEQNDADTPHSPVVLHASNARFRGLCAFFASHWFFDFGTFVRLLIEGEKMRRAGGEESDEVRWHLISYGLQIAPDSYILGPGVPDAFAVTSKKLILDILDLVAGGFEALAPRSTLPFDPSALRRALADCLPHPPGERATTP